MKKPATPEVQSKTKGKDAPARVALAKKGTGSRAARRARARRLMGT